MLFHHWNTCRSESSSTAIVAHSGFRAQLDSTGSPWLTSVSPAWSVVNPTGPPLAVTLTGAHLHAAGTARCLVEHEHAEQVRQRANVSRLALFWENHDSPLCHVSAIFGKALLGLALSNIASPRSVSCCHSLAGPRLRYFTQCRLLMLLANPVSQGYANSTRASFGVPATELPGGALQCSLPGDLPEGRVDLSMIDDSGTVSNALALFIKGTDRGIPGR